MDFGITEHDARKDRAAWLRRISDAVLAQEQAAAVEKAGRAYVAALEAIHPTIATDDGVSCDDEKQAEDPVSPPDDTSSQSSTDEPQRLNGQISSRVIQIIEERPERWFTTPEIRDEMKRRDWLGKANDSGGTLRYALNSAKERGLVEERQRDGRTKEFRIKPGVLRDARQTPRVENGRAGTLDFEEDLP